MFEATEKALAKFKAALDAVRNSKKTPEQIEKAKELYDSLDTGDRSLLEYIFPEVVESEDERVRKILIESFKKANCSKVDELVDCQLNKGEILAYLEKQKDSKGVDFDTKFDTREPRDNWEYIKEFCDKFGRIPKDMDELDVLVSYVMDKKQKEQKSIEDVIKDITKNKESATKFLKSSGIMDDNGELAEMYRSEQKLVEKQDYFGLNGLERAILHGFLCAGVDNVPVTIIKETAQECLSQMKPAEWSEEDERMLRTIISDGSRCVELDSKQIAWLKSLCPQPHWKPSEEQMAALNGAWTNFDSTNAILKTLYDDLKKLM